MIYFLLGLVIGVLTDRLLIRLDRTDVYDRTHPIAHLDDDDIPKVGGTQ